jgi:hypothetical protein
MENLGTAPSFLHPRDEDARVMADGGVWVTDFHSVFTDGARFRAGRWIAHEMRVDRLGEIRIDAGLSVVDAPGKGDGDERAFAFVRRPPAGVASVHAAFAVAVPVAPDALDEEPPVAATDRLLAVLIRTSSSAVVGWTPALFERTPMAAPPFVPMLRPRSRSFLVTSDRDHPIPTSSGEVALVGDRAVLITTEDLGEHQAWWGLDAEGGLAAFVVDVSGGLLREFERRQPTRDDPRRVANSCPRIVDDEAALVRRLEHLRDSGQIELDPDSDLHDVATDFFAQPDGNLRTWLLDATGVAEVFYSD